MTRKKVTKPGEEPSYTVTDQYSTSAGGDVNLKLCTRKRYPVCERKVFVCWRSFWLCFIALSELFGSTYDVSFIGRTYRAYKQLDQPIQRIEKTLRGPRVEIAAKFEMAYRQAAWLHDSYSIKSAKDIRSPQNSSKSMILLHWYNSGVCSISRWTCRHRSPTRCRK